MYEINQQDIFKVLLSDISFVGDILSIGFVQKIPAI